MHIIRTSAQADCSIALVIVQYMHAVYNCFTVNGLHLIAAYKLFIRRLRSSGKVQVSVLGTSTSPKYSSTSTSTLILKVLEYSKKYKLKKYSGKSTRVPIIKIFFIIIANYFINVLKIYVKFCRSIISVL